MTGVSRRKFIQTTSASGVGLVLGFVPGKSNQLVSGLSEIDLNQFISVGTGGQITLFSHRPEMGQGTYQSIPMILAEELEVNIDSVEIKPSAASQELYGSQMVVGSRSIQTEFEKLRKMGASAREMLKQAAANKWNIPLAQCHAEDGKVISQTGSTLTYAELATEAAKLKPPQNPVLKNPAEFKILGNPVQRRDIPLKTNGMAEFGIDISVPGMLFASVERSPVFLGKIESYNAEQALKVPGVKHVMETKRTVYGRERFGVAVLADSYWAALQGRKALKVSWHNQNLDKVSDRTISEDSLKAARLTGDELFGRGNPAEIFESSDQLVEASYQTPYQSHVPMEPMNATVRIGENSAEFWGSTQNPNGIRSFISKTYDIPEDRVNINYTFMGGGFGRRSMTDVVEEAADLSKKSGAPVKLLWTREDDQTQGPFRACSLNVCKGVLDESGKIIALEHKVIAQEIRNQTGDDMTAGRQLMGGINTDYKVPNLTVRGVLQKRHVPISYWRAVYHSTNPFAHECFIDELAHKAGKDPIAFRLEMLDHPRFVQVLRVVSEKARWNDQKPPDVGRGVAIAERSGAYFAMVVEVTRKNGMVVPTRITTALDLGICINPDTVKAQTEGSIVMGLGACYAGLNIEKGAIKQQNFNTYPLLRYGQCPEIITHIIESHDPPDGAGESGLPTVAPALVNAIFDLTGKRIRKLPLETSTI
ncbi:MAG: aldehyde oxidase [Cyclobacteriaceae bacterium]|nr:MAG: aldehyde oxidase [Cyclobacteriaceae bacterium]